MAAKTTSSYTISQDCIEHLGQTIEWFEERYDFLEPNDSADELFESFEDGGYNNPNGEICRIVGHLKRLRDAFTKGEIDGR